MGPNDQFDPGQSGVDGDRFSLLHLHAEPQNEAHPDEDGGQAGELVLRSNEPGQDGPSSAEGLSMLVSVAGHTDAGQLSEQMADSLLSALPHRQMASFDVDALFDYRSRRPRMLFTDSRFSEFQGPRLDLYELQDALGRNFLLLTGDEPDFHWEKVAETLLELANHLGVSLTVFADALGLPAPHTRPLGVTAHGNREDLVSGISTWSPNAQVEAGLSQMLEHRFDAAGHDVVGYTVHVPHYLASGKYPQVAVAALEYVGAASALMLPTDDLREAARAVESDITRQVQQNPQVAQVVEQLEQNFDQYATKQQRSLLVHSDDAVPDAEELGAAVEQYLRSQPGDSIFRGPEGDIDETLGNDSQHGSDEDEGPRD
ncbi:PAC2 family protein [Nesterenkonia sp. NBAIMH1]|uniref:PAC2 family protein n=1 Tax=Nesterenkonia sp. NBAIMH1 TaxID=2600320 RepID=UPI001FEF6FC9|nr:PAC2 family protein [Nesterenkonia sp. NBAIMH1]